MVEILTRVILLEKVNLHIKLISNDNVLDEKTIGTVNNDSDELIYFEKSTTKVKFNYQKNTLIRENNDLRLEFAFKKNSTTTGIINIKELQKNLEVDIKTIDIKQTKNSLEIKYLLEAEEYLYVISMEE